MSDWWTDYSQNRRLRELEDDLAAAQSHASSQSRTLRRELTSLRGNVEARLDRLAQAFDNFVELSDLREELAGFAAEASVRRRARHLTIGLGLRATDPTIPPPPAVEIDDIPTYWLVPAIEALSALTREDMAVADRAVAEACQRDPHRTAVFLTLGLTVAGQPTGAGPWIEEAFTPLEATTTRLQRLLWQTAAHGTHGDVGRDLVIRRAQDFVRALDDQQTQAMVEDIRRRLPAYDAALLPAGLRGFAPRPPKGSRASTPALAVPRHAQDQLAVLVDKCHDALSTPPAATGPAPATPSGTASPAELLRALIDEGHGDEIPLLRRAAELRHAVEAGSEPRRHWDAAAGQTVDLLNADATGGDRPMRAVAVRACAPMVLRVADELFAAAKAPIPDEVTVRTGSVDIRVRPDQPDAATLAEAHAVLDRRVPNRTTRRMAIAVAAGGLALSLLGGVTLNWFFLVVGVAGVAGAGALWRQANMERRDDAARLAAEHASLNQKVRTVAEQLAAYHATVEKARDAAAAKRDELAALFG